MQQMKTCRKCGKDLPATLEFFYKNTGGKFGLTPRCKTCVNEDNALSHAKRLAADPVKIRAQATARSKKSYQKHLEPSRKRHRDYQAKLRSIPERYAEIQAKKRGGGARLSAEELEAMFQAQGCVCAICGSDKSGSQNGWNVDHCHKTNQVRFVLCAHCNRGLGAFRDNPDWLRKAAEMLETFNQNQADRPVDAIYE